MSGQKREQWITIAEATIVVERSKARIYEWLRRPESGIRQITIKGVKYVERGSLLAYEATVQNGRPRKDAK